MSNFTKFFRNGKTFSGYCRMRYGKSKEIWDDTSLWVKAITLSEQTNQTKQCSIYAIAFDQDAADTKFPPINAEIK